MMSFRMNDAIEDPVNKSTRPKQRPKLTHEKNMLLQQDGIEWSNLIFLPFHPVFQMFILCSVFIKATLGPLQAVYPIVYCKDSMESHAVLILIKYCYWYGCDFLYGIDTFLHIVHRQVNDKAMRREHLPKSATLLMCDLISLVPFFRLLETEPCPPAQLWPNILAFNEFVVIYRVTQYFSLLSTHSFWKLLIGFTIVLCMCVNCLTCFWLLLTEHGFCGNCTDPANYYDWRAYVFYKLNETDERYTTYVYGAAFVLSFTLNVTLDGTKPSAILEYGIICILMVAGYILTNFIVIPKTFAESMLRLRTICVKYPAVKKNIEDTKRRNPSTKAYLQVEQYYKHIWRRRTCIVKVPQFLSDIPRYLRLEIKQDLVWPLYYHSPTLRKISHPLRRWLSESIVISYKFPGERFYTSDDSHTSLFYLKSGIVQLISVDDGTTPILSVTGGTIFGDINFLVPHVDRKVIVNCVTYCEIYFVKREILIRGLHKYPLDRRIVMRAARNRIEHAKILFSNKKQLRGLDRTEDEGIAWIKTHWWEFYNVIHNWTTYDHVKINLPRNALIYHCPKYIGQLVLCSKTQLQTKSMFTNLKFPWILNPQSHFGSVWNRIITGDVLLVLFLYPPNLIKPEIPEWFEFFTFWSDAVYAFDIGVSLLTAVKKQDSVTTTFSAVLFERFKSFTFILDLLSTIWIEEIFYMMGATQYYYALQFNRLIKVYILFYGDYLKWDIRSDPLVSVARTITLLQIAVTFIISNALFEVSRFFPAISMKYFYGEELCTKADTNDCFPIDPVAGVSISWAFEWTFSEYLPEKLVDIYVATVLCYMYYILHTYFKGRIISYLYLKKKNVIKYQNFVSHLKNYYAHYGIHQDLIRRLDRYLICHWKYYKGIDVLYPNTLKEESHEIYMKGQGEVAQKIISHSKPFSYADPALVKALAYEGKFLLLPKYATLFVFGMQCKNVAWVVQGFIKSEHHDDDGQLSTTYYGPGSMLSAAAIFFGRVSLKTYTSYTDSEILYIPLKNFWDIYKRHKMEFLYLENCLKEFGPMFDEMFKDYVVKHRDYQLKLRDRLANVRMSTSTRVDDDKKHHSLPFEGYLYGDSESGVMVSWMLFRVIVVCISVASATLLGGVGSEFRQVFMVISALCDCIALIDIFLKLFLAYYDDRGILITSKRKCLINYLTKVFVLDMIGALPWFTVLNSTLAGGIDENTGFLINSVCKFAHVYIVFAYFDYISDVPTVNSYVMIIKWQIVNILIVMVASHYFMVKCVHFHFNDQMKLVDVEQQNTCWMPKVFKIPKKLNKDYLHLIFAQSLNLAECGMMRMNFGRFWINREQLGVGVVLFILGLTFWFISCYTLTLLVLEGRGDTEFQQGVCQLHRFLGSERVEKEIIKKVMDHFQYCWVRSRGVNIEQLTNDRISVMFRQDLSYSFYKKTLTILDSLLGGGDIMQRHLAGVSTIAHFLPKYEICREKDLMTTVCIVHRGRVNIFKDGKKIIILTKGDIFGQLKGTKIRPVRVTAIAEDHVDILYIDIPAFQNIINDDVRQNIAENPQSRNDVLATKHILVENPYDTVKYLLPARKTIMLPWSKYPTEARQGSWYSRWLYLVWFIGPFLSSIFVILFITLPPNSKFLYKFYIALTILDAVQLLNIIAEFYTIELVVDGKKVVPRRLGWKKLKVWSFYLEIFALFFPMFTLHFHSWKFQLARVLRLKLFFDFHFHFCKCFKSRLTPIMLKLAILILLLHSFTCGWIHFACRDKFPIYNPDMRQMTVTIDFSQWAHPDDRKWGGCARVTRNIPDGLGGKGPAFVVPRYWPHDYVVAMTYILLIYTHTSLDITMAVSLKQVYYKILITYFMYLLDMWLMSLAINFAYSKYRDLYQYDFLVQNLMTYLTNCGLGQNLKDKVLEYSTHLWNRQRGDWLPELAYQAPPSLRHDIFSALYIHHLDSAPTFRSLPIYFKRQLAARLRRTVVFPGKCIVQKGDIFNTAYFIHEGEVEKWFSDPSSGDGQLLSVLYTNGYFGYVSGLLTNSSFQFSYYARTVVDLVYLNLNNWRDLLEGYPDIKTTLLDSTRRMKTELTQAQYGKSLYIHVPTVDPANTTDTTSS